VTVSLLAGMGWNGDAQGDSLTGIEHLVGSAFNDTLIGDNGWNALTGGGGADALYGKGGDDNLNGGAGADYLHGGDGIDLANYMDSPGGVTVNLATGATAGGDAQGDVLVAIENVQGSSFADTITGSAGDNLLAGWKGNDVINGGAGADIIDGGGGQDSLTGGSGADTFVFYDLSQWGGQGAQASSPAGNPDWIWDFKQAEGDKIDLSEMDANWTVGADQDFIFIGAGQFTGTAGELRFEKLPNAVFGKWTSVSADTDGDGAADFQVLCAGWINFTANDFVL
jgi:Ca2+-binding RTX toxin-like protein